MGEVDEIRKMIKGLEERVERLEAGEELCDHHWNGSDGCYECYCSNCEKHILEAPSIHDVPFKADALCYQCRTAQTKKG